MQALREVAPDDSSAISEGRLFANGRRITDQEAQLDVGQIVTCYSPRSGAEGSGELARVLDRRCGIIAASKPAAWSSEPDRTGTTSSLRERLAAELGAPQLHVATRLDVGVSGLVLLATDEASRLHLDQVMAAGACHRRYLGFVGARLPDRGCWRGAVETEQRAKRERSPREAVTHFECIKQMTLANCGITLLQRSPLEAVSLVIFRPETGHRHQLRIHSSRAGAPILGDRRYGGAQRMIEANGRVSALDRIYLHALSTTLPLPDGSAWHIECAVPDAIRELWRKFGGDQADLVETRC
jgi:23S rRNA-/tRNA-specific pseudouridylate synthase